VPPTHRHRRFAFTARPRFYVAVLVGTAIAIVPIPLHPTLHLIIGWDVGVTVYLALILAMASRATTATMHHRAALEDETRWLMLGLMVAAALFSMFALVGPLHDARNAGTAGSTGLTALAGVTVLLSWAFAHTLFAVHYAHEYYDNRTDQLPPGILFPGGDADPDYWDFIYFSFVVGMTSQVSDVQVTSRPWRRLVLAHGMLSFLFNAVVLALCINLLAGLL